MRYYFDMDGTIADFYGVDHWLDMLIDGNPYPYMVAKPMFYQLARVLNRLVRDGNEIFIISWLAKNSTQEFDELVKMAKIHWLKQHLPSVCWSHIYILPYGTDKGQAVGATFEDVLFDDEDGNRQAWCGNAYPPEMMMKILRVKH